MLGLKWVEANKIDLPLGWKNGQVQRPLPVLTIVAGEVLGQRTGIDLISVLVGLGVVED